MAMMSIGEEEKVLEKEKGLDLRVDFLFRCNYCIKLIAQDRPVYMRHDCSYCSTACRRRGRSSLYANLMNIQLERLRELRHSPSESGTSALSTAMSDSSLTSSKCTERGRRGPLGWVLGKVFDVISNRLLVSPLVPATVHAASSALLGRIQPGSSLHRLLGYVPEAHSFLGLADTPSLSGHSESTGILLSRN